MTMPDRSFPTDFVWGAATAAYQVEGAVHEDGRSESIWDRFAHTPGTTFHGDTGDVACDHYHRYREDVALLAELGLGAYRFSVAWPRVIPGGTGPVNEAGLDFYDRLVDELLAKGIAPFVTLYHWDLPQVLEDAGGWPLRATVDAFAEYAAVVAGRLGDRVRHFVTFNEPRVVATLGYEDGIFAPGRHDLDDGLAAAHHLLVAHGRAVQAIRAVAPDASVGIVLDIVPKQSASTEMLDLESAAAAQERHDRWFLDPLTGRGYPPDPPENSWRHLIRDGDLELITAPIDFLGVNYYTRDIVRSPMLPPLPAVEREKTGFGWEVYPEGLGEVLRFVASRTGDLPLYITENGAAYPDHPSDPTHDPERVRYLRRHLAALADARSTGIPVRGYFVWSLLDNFEWIFGYSQRFGIVHVDFATQERRVRDSGRFLEAVARSGRLPAEPSTAGD